MQERSRLTTVVAPPKAWLGRNTRTLLSKGTAAFLLLVFATISLHGNWPVALLWVSGGIGLWGLYDVIRRYRERALILKDVDTMADGEFLRYAADLLRAQGYTVHKVGHLGDSRIDLLLGLGRENLVCRLQRQSKRVGEDTVTEVLAALEAHGCGRAMLLANQLFTRQARYLARRKGCVLIDRASLASLVAQYRQGHRVLAFHREEVLGVRRKR